MERRLRVGHGRDDDPRGRAPALLLVVDRLAEDSAREEPAAARQVDADADRAVDERLDERVIDAALDERNVVRAHLEPEVVRLFLLPERHPERVGDVVRDPEILDGDVAAGEVGFAERSPRPVELGADRDPRAAELGAVDGLRGARVARMPCPVDVEPSADLEHVPAVRRCNFDTRGAD